MKLITKSIEWADGEAYAIHVDIEDDGKRVKHVGHMWRESPTKWRYSAGPNFEPDTDSASAVKASTAAEALKEIERRTEFVSVKRDRLSDEVMAKHVDSVCDQMLSLATQADALVGYARGLSAAVATACVTTFDDPQNQAKFLELFTTEVRREVDALMGAKAMNAVFGQFVRNMIQEVAEHTKAESDNTPKH